MKCTKDIINPEWKLSIQQKVHLDQGKKMSQILRCIRKGYLFLSNTLPKTITRKSRIKAQLLKNQ